MTTQTQQYQAAITENFPDLTINTCEPFYEGWANRTVLVNQSTVFRFPKHETAAQELMDEMRLLPELAPPVPLPIPEYIYQGQPTAHFSLPFGGYPLLRGTLLSQCSDEVKSATWWKAQLGAFLTALHTFPITRIPQLLDRDVPLTTGSWITAIHGLCERIKTQVLPLLTTHQQRKIGVYLDEVMADESIFSFTPVLIHQDFYEHNILVDVETETVTGILDWGSCSVGDPAEDVGDLLPYYEGVVDAGWAARCAFYAKTAPFPDLLYVLEHDQRDRIPRIMDYINRLWKPS
ncbi:MAG: phosphotransferase [Chloroflexota bacterium]